MRNNINLNHLIRTYRTSSKASLEISYLLDKIIIGNLLGDGHISLRNTYSNSRFEFTQSIKNRIYIDHLYSLFKDYCGAKPRIRTITLKSQPGKEYKSIGFKTLCLPCFNIYREIFYKFNGMKYNKIVPKNIGKLLTPIGLAYWIMDDGSKMSGEKGVILCTESVTLEENYLLVEILRDNYYLNCNIQESSSRIRINIKKESMDYLISIVKPHMLPHFYYKLGI